MDWFEWLGDAEIDCIDYNLFQKEFRSPQSYWKTFVHFFLFQSLFTTVLTFLNWSWTQHVCWMQSKVSERKKGGNPQTAASVLQCDISLHQSTTTTLLRSINIFHVVWQSYFKGCSSKSGLNDFFPCSVSTQALKEESFVTY